MDGITVRNGVEIIDCNYMGIGGLVPGDITRVNEHASTQTYAEDGALGIRLPNVYITEER